MGMMGYWETIKMVPIQPKWILLFRKREETFYFFYTVFDTEVGKVHKKPKIPLILQSLINKQRSSNFCKIIPHTVRLKYELLSFSLPCIKLYLLVKTMALSWNEFLIPQPGVQSCSTFILQRLDSWEIMSE